MGLLPYREPGLGWAIKAILVVGVGKLVISVLSWIPINYSLAPIQLVEVLVMRYHDI
jgi:hypothetical protein